MLVCWIAKGLHWNVWTPNCLIKCTFGGVSKRHGSTWSNLGKQIQYKLTVEPRPSPAPSVQQSAQQPCWLRSGAIASSLDPNILRVQQGIGRQTPVKEGQEKWKLFFTNENLAGSVLAWLRQSKIYCYINYVSIQGASLRVASFQTLAKWQGASSGSSPSPPLVTSPPTYSAGGWRLQGKIPARQLASPRKRKGLAARHWTLRGRSPHPQALGRKRPAIKHTKP